jgi:hypothetical protein
MHCQQGGEVWAWNGLLDAFRRFSGGFETFLGSVVHRSDRSRSPVWPVRVLVLWPVWPVWAEIVAATLFSSGLHAFVQREVHWLRGSLHVCRGSCLWLFKLWFGGLRSLLVLTLFPVKHTNALDRTVVRNQLAETPSMGRSNRLGGRSNRLG